MLKVLGQAVVVDIERRACEERFSTISALRARHFTPRSETIADKTVGTSDLS
jgi:hypothetical protein